MSNVLYFPNLHRLGESPTSTATTVTAADTTVHACLDVFPRNDVTNPLNVSVASVTATENMLAQDIHDASAAAINGSAGAFVAFGSGITIPAGVDRVQVSSTMGEPIRIAFAANVGAAAAATKNVFLVEGGAPGTLSFIPGADNKVFIRSLSTTGVTSGYVALNFLG